MKFLVTGGAGFIGSNYLHYVVNKYPEDEFEDFGLLALHERSDRRLVFLFVLDGRVCLFCVFLIVFHGYELCYLFSSFIFLQISLWYLLRSFSSSSGVRRKSFVFSLVSPFSIQVSSGYSKHLSMQASYP